jgi:DNA-binding NarL/FixJ family response regulator
VDADARQEALVEALDQIVAGGVVLPPGIASKVMRTCSESNSLEDPQRLWDLTFREIEILEFLHDGQRNADIARTLDISLRTVETHVSSIIAKLDARSRTEAVRKAIESGLIR